MTTPEDQRDPKIHPALDALLKKLEEVTIDDNDDVHIFNKAEVSGMLEILKHKESIVAEFEYRAARRILWAKWRSLIIGTASFLAALYLIWDKIGVFGTWLAKSLTK